MVTLQRYDFATKKLGEVEFDETIFGDRARLRCLREAALMYAANRRLGCADTKERSEVAGTTKKPWKQKHTGRARAGSKKSPIWRGGGTIFGPHPRDFGYARPRTELRVALRGALFGKLVDKEVALVANLAANEPSSKSMRALFGAFGSTFGKGIGTDSSCCVVLGDANENLWRSLRNYPKVAVRTASDVNADDVLRHRLVVLTEEAAGKLTEGHRHVAVAAKRAAGVPSAGAAAKEKKVAKKAAAKKAGAKPGGDTKKRAPKKTAAPA
jgi:large subunit ribosomal protein L4